MSTTITSIRKLCSDCGMPAEDIERVIAAVSGFYDADLQIRAAQALADAWQEDRAQQLLWARERAVSDQEAEHFAASVRDALAVGDGEGPDAPAPRQ